MLTYIYRSEKKTYCYLYLKSLAEDFEFPGAVEKVLGELHFVMELEITEETKLAIAKPKEVLAAIDEQGFYVQMPSDDPHPFDTLFA